MAFLAKRLANEQAPVVDDVIDTLETMPLDLFHPDHVPHLQKLRDDVALSEDSMVSTHNMLSRISLKILRRQLYARCNPEGDKLLAFALDTLYRSVLSMHWTLTKSGSGMKAVVAGSACMWPLRTQVESLRSLATANTGDEDRN